MEDNPTSEGDFLETNLEEIYDDESKEDVAVFVDSIRGKPCLELNGYRYRKAYRSKNGYRWNCATHKSCTSFLYLNDNDEIIMIHESHSHEPVKKAVAKCDNETEAIVIQSRKGKDMLLYRQFTYRKQYVGGKRARWVCSTSKNCKAYVFTNSDNYILSLFDKHCHPPPKYYSKADHVFNALKGHIILETD